MTSFPTYFRLRIRNKADDDDLLILSSVPDGENPYITQPPDGDGQSIDPITGAPTTGAYNFRVADAVTDENTRVVTAQLADVNGRQQLLGLRAYAETSATGAVDDWQVLVPAYVTACRLVSAIEYEIGIGQTRRKEQSREIFKEASTTFPGVTCVIGGPVIGGFSGLLPETVNSNPTNGWKFRVNQVNSTPGYVQIKILEGFDPRKYPYDDFSTVSQAITDFTNDWARPYFEPATQWLGASTPIQGQFPKLRARLVPVGGDDEDALYFVPLSEPEAITGVWWGDVLGDNLTRSGESSLWLPRNGVEADGVTTFSAWNPAVDDEFWVWVYALPISKENPLHIYERPVDLFEKVCLELGYEAGVDYDDTVLSDLTDALNLRLGGDVKLALRITDSTKAADFLRTTVFGPFRFSSRIVDGLLQLISISVVGSSEPTTTVTVDDLTSDEGTVFDIDEATVVTAVVLKQQRLRRWVETEDNQPEADGLISSPWPTNSIENSADDIPPGMENEVEIGNIPGMILLDDPDPDDIVPLPFDPFLISVADELFQRFGRGAIEGEISVLPDVTEQVGDEINVNLVHRPVADVAQSPISQRGGIRRVQIVQRTERPEGPQLRIVDSALSEPGGGVDTGVGGGTEEEEDPTTIGTPADPIAFAVGGPYGIATANWVDSYPQFFTFMQWEAHAPGETTFSVLYGGEHVIERGVFSDSMSGIGTGWVVRCRYRLTDSLVNSAWSGYSNEVEIEAAAPPTPTDVPTDLEATSTTTDEAHGEWVNTNVSLDIKIQWQASVQDPGPPTVWGNVAGGIHILAATTDEDDQATGAGQYARFRVCYVNSAGVQGPWSDYSDYVEIME